VLIQHGILDSADSWIVRGKDSVGITLANEGYDVWFANSRGSTHSRTHSYLKIDDEDYWQFSHEEIGDYDVLATIDYIIKENGYPQVAVIGHSTGATAVIYAMANGKI
jgi:lysosomal acid lipase/cholesteryl ester hydrolase